MKLPWRTARNLNRIGGSIKRAQEICRGRERVNDSKLLSNTRNNMDDIYENIEECNPDKDRKILIVFGGMIADILSKIKLNPIVTELLVRGRKLNLSLAFMTQSCFAPPKYIRLNSAHSFIMKFPYKLALQQIVFVYLSDTGLKSPSLQKMHCKTILFFSD